MATKSALAQNLFIPFIVVPYLSYFVLRQTVPPKRGCFGITRHLLAKITRTVKATIEHDMRYLIGDLNVLKRITVDNLEVG
jgi:hypothetical protein